MPIEQFNSEQAAQMFYSWVEFIALFSLFSIAGVWLIWSGLAIWVGQSERRQRRGKR